MSVAVARRQCTLARPASVEGFGYFSGQDARLEFWPAPEGAGISFIRHDLGPQARVPAVAAFRIDAPRRTTLEAGVVRVEMVEHVLAALAGLGVDNCEVWVDAAEIPGCDGSAAAFVEAILEAGLIDQRAPVPQIVVERPLRIGHGESWIEIQRPRGAGLSVSYLLDFGAGNPIGRQHFTIDVAPHSFRQQLAACRTFIEETTAQQMRAQGLGQRVTPRDLLIFGPQGPIDNRLRFPDECARHKVLDVVGDLALTGCEVVGHVIAHRSGHRLHAELARQLREQAGLSNEPSSAAALRRCA
jgi:UDP-3-O-acyl N-acetylglucosamine deacetylase